MFRFYNLTEMRNMVRGGPIVTIDDAGSGMMPECFDCTDTGELHTWPEALKPRYPGERGRTILLCWDCAEYRIKDEKANQSQEAVGIEKALRRVCPECCISMPAASTVCPMCDD